MNSKKFRSSGKGLFMMAFGSAGGYGFASLISSSFLETDKSFKKNLEKIVPNKVKNPRRIQVERKSDPNDYYLEEKEREQKMQEILQGMQAENKLTHTQQQLQKYHLRKNCFYGLLIGSVGALLTRRFLSLFNKRGLPLYLGAVVTAPTSVLAYYSFSGAFDNLGHKAVIDKLAEDAPVLICVKVLIDVIRMAVRQMSRDTNIANMNLLQKAKAEKVDLKTVKMFRVNPMFSFLSTLLLMVWFVYVISVYEERVEANFASLRSMIRPDISEDD